MAEDAAAVLDARAVHKRFGERQVLDGASLCVHSGEIVGLLGPNGAGKSTFLNIASGLLPADAGSVRVAGVDVERRGEFAGLLGSAPQDIGVYPMLSVRENLLGFAGLYGLRGKRARQRVDAVIEALGLTAQTSTRADELSGGQRRRLHTGLALCHEPRLLFLDEPTVGADVESRQQIVDLVRSLAARGSAIVYTTHYLGEVEALAANVAVLDGGRITGYGQVARVIEEWGANEVAIRVSQHEDAAHAALPEWQVEGEWLTRLAQGVDPAKVLAQAILALSDLAEQVREVDIRRSSLENAYLRILASGRAAGAATPAAHPHTQAETEPHHAAA